MKLVPWLSGLGERKLNQISPQKEKLSKCACVRVICAPYSSTVYQPGEYIQRTGAYFYKDDMIINMNT